MTGFDYDVATIGSWDLAHLRAHVVFGMATAAAFCLLEGGEVDT